MSAKLANLTNTAHRTAAEALSAEARSNECAGLNGVAERAAFVAQEAIDALAYYAKSLEDKLAAANAELDKIAEREGERALDAYMAGDPNA